MQIFITGTSILTDQIFVDYGGQTGTSTVGQRNAAYMIAEQEASQYLNTYLIPTQVEETIPFPIHKDIIPLYYKPVISVESITLIRDVQGEVSQTIETEGRITLVDANSGYVRVSDICSNNVLRNIPGNIDRMKILYTAGYPDGTVSNNAKALMGLVTIAGLALEQITNPEQAEGGHGDPSLSSFSDAGYSESRQFLKMTTFGGSPRANYAQRMLSGLKYKRTMKFG